MRVSLRRGCAKMEILTLWFSLTSEAFFAAKWNNPEALVLPRLLRIRGCGAAAYTPFFHWKKFNFLVVRIYGETECNFNNISIGLFCLYRAHEGEIHFVLGKYPQDLERYGFPMLIANRPADWPILKTELFSRIQFLNVNKIKAVLRSKGCYERFFQRGCGFIELVSDLFVYGDFAQSS